METNGAGYDAGGQDAQGEPQGTTEVRGRLIGLVRGHTVDVGRGMAGVVAARGPVSVKQGMAGAMLATGDASVERGYATCVGTLGQAHLHQAGTQWLFTAKGVEIDQGGAMVAAAPRVTVRRGFLGLALAQHVDLDEGSKLIFTPKSAAAFGAVFGAVFALVSLAGLRKRWKHD